MLLLGGVFFVVVRGLRPPHPVDVADGATLVVSYTRSDLPLDPTAEFWSFLEPVRVALLPQAARPPFGTEEREVWVRGAHNESAVGFLVEFDDPTVDRHDSLASDGCAIMWSPANAAPVAQMMGHHDRANIWHWIARSDTSLGVRTLIAEGPGTQSLLPEQYVEGRAVHRDGRWLVTFRRERRSRQEGELALAADTGQTIAFAIWDGSLQETLSQKSISIVRSVHFAEPIR